MSAKCEHETGVFYGSCAGCVAAIAAGLADEHEAETFGPIERDPSGADPHTAGAKLDHGKARAGLCLHGFARALLAVSEVTTFGAKKYTPDGWIAVPDGINRYTDALYRHMLYEATGEEVDRDSLLLHAAHSAWNALARLDLMLREREQGECQK